MPRSHGPVGHALLGSSREPEYQHASGQAFNGRLCTRKSTFQARHQEGHTQESVTAMNACNARVWAKKSRQTNTHRLNILYRLTIKPHKNHYQNA